MSSVYCCTSENVIKHIWLPKPAVFEMKNPCLADNNFHQISRKVTKQTQIKIKMPSSGMEKAIETGYLKSDQINPSCELHITTLQDQESASDDNVLKEALQSRQCSRCTQHINHKEIICVCVAITFCQSRGCLRCATGLQQSKITKSKGWPIEASPWCTSTELESGKTLEGFPGSLWLRVTPLSSVRCSAL